MEALVSSILFATVAPGISGQVLARPGWAGSGVQAEPWWHSAVIYRVDTTRFQDAGSTGRGSLAGAAERFDYLEALGVDAIALETTPGFSDSAASPGGAAGNASSDLDDFIRAGSQHRLRVLMAITPSQAAGARPDLLAEIRSWLGAGAAGVALLGFGATNGGVDTPTDPSLIAEVNRLVQSFPGGRVLLADPTPGMPAAPGSASGGAGPAFSNTQGGQLLTAAMLPTQPLTAAGMRGSLAALAAGTKVAKLAPGTAPLLRFAQAPSTGSSQAAGAAAVLFASGGAALFDFGEEIGLATDVPGGNDDRDPSRRLPVMQWTPFNVTQPPPAPIVRAAPATPSAAGDGFGAYHPYVRPSSPPLQASTPADGHPAAQSPDTPPPPDPDSLPGFTAGTLPGKPQGGERVNVATEDRDPGSVLNAYRRLIALHHGNATLRDGSVAVLNRDAENAVVWVRRAAPGVRADVRNRDVIGAVNLGDAAITLTLDSDLAGLHVRGGALRPLFSFASQPLTGETTGTLRLPPHAVFLGEILPSAARVSRRAEQRSSAESSRAGNADSLRE